MKTLLLWLSMFFFVVLGIVLSGGHVGAFVQKTAACVVFLPVLCYLVYSFGFKGFFSFWKRIFTNNLGEDDSIVADVSVMLGFLFGAIGAISGMIHVMENLADTSKLGAGVAVAFISCAYGILPAVMFLPLKKKEPVKASGTATSNMKKAAGFMMFTLLLLGWNIMAVLFATSPH